MRTGLRSFVLSLAAIVLQAAAASAFETKTLPDFTQLVAVQARPQGGFAVVGSLRDQAGKGASGFVEIGDDGVAVAPIIPLPGPDAQHAQVLVSSLLLLPDGDYVAAGLALDASGKPDGWMIRFNPNGEIIWNMVLPNPWDQRIITVRLVNGMLIGVGKTQEGPRVQQASLGYWVFVDPRTGKKDSDGNLKASPETRRSGFYDVTDSVDGGLVFVGWATKANGTDDMWLAKYLKGQDDRILITGEADNDVAYTVVPSGQSLIVGATRRKSAASPVGAILIYDKNLNNPNVLALDRWSPGLSQLKALIDIPSTGRMVVVGEAARTVSADTRALLGIVRVTGGSASIETGPNEGIAGFRAVAIDSSGTIAMVGDGRTAKNQPSQGLVGLRKIPDLCSPDATAIKQISDALAAGPSLPQATCATTEHTARFKLGKGAADTALVVRPIIGDIDAFLVRGDDVLDASVNSRMRAELLMPPAEGTNLDLVVSSQTPFALFEVSRRTLTAPGTETATSGGSAADKALTLSKDAVALQMLGYELLASTRRLALYTDRTASSDADDEIEAPLGMRRAILAFQAAQGFPMTGRLGNDDRWSLHDAAARLIDTQAQAAAGAARDVAKDLPPVSYEGMSAASGAFGSLSSMQGGVHDGRIYGEGTFKKDVSFEGEWLDGDDSGPQRRPSLGVLTAGEGCTVALRTFQLSASYSAADLLYRSIGVIRKNGKILYQGDLAGVLPSTGSPGRPTGQEFDITQVCNRT